MKNANDLFEGIKIVYNQQELDAAKSAYPDYDPQYVAVGSRLEHRKFWENLWIGFQDLADPHFLSEIKIHFPQRAWEIYVGSMLRDKKFDVKSNSYGPDFIVDNKYYIECVVPTSGQHGAINSVPEIKFNKLVNYPLDQILLRIAPVIKEKNNKYMKWKEKSNLRNLPYIVALSTGWMGYLDNPSIPNCIKVLFSVGPLVIPLNEGGNFYAYKDNIEKHKKNNVNCEVPIGLFDNHDYKNISAVIFSCDVGCGLEIGYQLGKTCYIVKNPLAKNQLSDEFCSRFNEFVVKNRGQERTFNIVMRK